MTIVRCDTCNQVYDGTRLSSVCPHTDSAALGTIIRTNQEHDSLTATITWLRREWASDRDTIALSVRLIARQAANGVPCMQIAQHLDDLALRLTSGGKLIRQGAKP